LANNIFGDIQPIIIIAKMEQDKMVIISMSLDHKDLYSKPTQLQPILNGDFKNLSLNISQSSTHLVTDIQLQENKQF